MDVNKIKNLLETNRDVIISLPTKADKLDRIITLFEQTFPQVTLSDALNGPITNMTAMMDNVESQKLIGYIKQMKEISGEATIIGFSGSQDYEIIMKYIQEFVS